jgi:glycosyltransferase involved in cell wall biosynthesis
MYVYFIYMNYEEPGYMRKKIVLIGPVYPYKGGISHYTGKMYRTLAKTNDVEMISYKMQYPKFLFKKEQKDYGNNSFEIKEAKYLINTANPFNIIKTARYIRRQKPDMVIVQWWHPYFAPCYILLGKFMGKQNLTYVCHNVFPHERFPMDRLLTKLTLKMGTHFIVHAKEEAAELALIKKDADYKITPHPTYDIFNFHHMTRGSAREKLGLPKDSKVLLFFGFVREYKGLKHLLNAMPDITAVLDDIQLLVVGDFDRNKDQYLSQIEELGIKDSVKVIDGYIPDRDVEQYFAASDLVVLPYESATQSGIVQIAYGFDRPVIVTRVGGLPDVVEDGRTGYIIAPHNPCQLTAAVTDFYKNQRQDAFEKAVEEQAYRFSWDRMAEVVDGFGR